MDKKILNIQCPLLLLISVLFGKFEYGVLSSILIITVYCIYIYNIERVVLGWFEVCHNCVINIIYKCHQL